MVETTSMQGGIAVIGAGRIGAAHIEAVSRAEDLELVASCDINPRRTQRRVGRPRCARTQGSSS